VTVHNVKQLKRLNQAIFPVIYNDKFYKDVLQFGELVKLGIPTQNYQSFIMLVYIQNGHKPKGPLTKTAASQTNTATLIMPIKSPAVLVLWTGFTWHFRRPTDLR